MAKQYLTKYQRGAINRFYEQADARWSNVLQELVSELALAEGAKADKLWKKARESLEKLGVEPARIEKGIGGKDVKAFAALVAELIARPGKLMPQRAAEPGQAGNATRAKQTPSDSDDL